MKPYILLFLFIFFSSCGSKLNTSNLKKTNDLAILNYLKKNNLKAQRTNSGLYYIIDKIGKGKSPTKKSTITAYYKGFQLNGRVFDKSDFRGVTFKLQEVISGWREGFTYLKVGDEALFFVPAHLAYGKNGNGKIPGGAVLIFDVKLISIH